MEDKIPEQKSLAHESDQPETSPVPPASIEELIYDLQVHQEELRMQNDELLRLQQELFLEKEQFTDLYNFAPIGYFTLNEEGIIERANLTLCTMLNLEKSRLVQQPLTKFIFHKDQDTYYLKRKILFETHSPQFCELRLVASNGSLFWARLDAVSVQDGGQTVCRVAVSDISKIKELEDAWRSTADKYFGLFTEMLAGCALHEVIYDPAGAPVDYITLEVNNAYEAIMGVAKEDVIGRKASEILPEQELKCWMEVFGPVVLTGKSTEYELFSSLNKKYFTGTAYCPLPGKFAVTFMDNTVRRQTELALQESESRYRNIVQGSEAGYFFVDQDGLYQYVNEAWLNMHGYDRAEEVTGQHFSLTQTAGDLYEAQKIVEQLLAGIPIPGGEFTRRKRDGTVGYHTFSANPVLRFGKVVGLEGFLIDITDRKLAEVSLQKSERYFRLVTETILDVFWISTPGVAEMIYVSPAYERLWGNSLESLYASPRSFLDVIHPEDLEYYLGVMSIYHARGKAYECEYRIVPDGASMRWIHERGYPITDDQGKVIMMTGVCTDVSEYKLTEDALRESEERFRKVFEEGPVGMVLTSRDMKFVSANSAFYRMLGYTEADLKTMTIIDITHPDHRERDRENVEKLWQGKIPLYQTDKRYIARNGAIRWGNLSTSVIKGHDGQPLYALAMIEDITERKAVEVALRHSLDEIAHTQSTLFALNRAGQAIQQAQTSDEIYRLMGKALDAAGMQCSILHLTEDKKHLVVSQLNYDFNLLSRQT